MTCRGYGSPSAEDRTGNTVRYAEIIDGLRAEGFPASEEDIAYSASLTEPRS
jgi:hypothetical protein